MLKCILTNVFVIVVKHCLIDQSSNSKQSKELMPFGMVALESLGLLFMVSAYMLPSKLINI